MYRNKHILCVICARGGSKGIPGKNIKPINGKPLLAYAIEAATKSKCFDDIVVSTDSEQIRKFANEFGDIAPFTRPAGLAGDNVGRIEAVKHAVEWMEKNGVKYDIVADLGAVTPLRITDDIKKPIDMLIDGNHDNVFSVTPCSRNPYYNMVEEVEGKISVVKDMGEDLSSRQRAPKVYDMNDSINVMWRDNVWKHARAFSGNSMIYVMPRERSIDIDEPIDLLIVSTILNSRPQSG